MWIKIKDDLYNLSNFHAIRKGDFDIILNHFERVFNIHFDTQDECDREFERIEKLLLEGKYMQYREISYKIEEEWHSIRQKHIGGSDVSVIMGYNEYKNPIILWEEKTGRREQEDLSDNEAVQRGKLSENLLIEHFKINNPGYTVGKLEKTLESLKFGFMSANLDGTLKNEMGEMGVLEIKTATCHSYQIYKDKWQNDIPIEYYLQIQHYLYVTGWKYAILYADIKLAFADNKHEIKQYFIERDEEDIELIKQKEIEFNSFIVNDIKPPLTIKLAV